MFDRQIKNMDVQNDVNRQGALAQAIVAPITGAAAGATAGAKISGGNPYAAIAGGVAGAIGGAATGALDYSNTVRMMEENRQYAIDMYGYNLQNIQAIPTSLTKTSALTDNTHWSCHFVECALHRSCGVTVLVGIEQDNFTAVSYRLFVFV